MSEFRSVLGTFHAGQVDLPTLESELSSTLERDPRLALELAELIESSHGAGRIPRPVYLRLIDIVHAVTHPGGSMDASGPHSAAADDDATRMRRPGAAGSLPDETLISARPDPSDARSGRSTGSGWGDPARWAEGETRTLQAGDVVKERFVLEEIIGRGGMGVVFRARDLRKEEAQDRHPYVALKVLNDDFKRHPESLKALQREARKAQNLAHPNIVTVYDFDRDGANVYMVMELLEGEPLDRHISRHVNGIGLPEALQLIGALGGALSYAHEHGVVHSDFKPANAFLTRRGAVKVFDFGIARAARRPGELDDTTAQTLFDPGTLGALTPAYASCEMIDGLEPDPRDDVYALGCVAYELLSGRHPFARKPATQARFANLKPAPLRGLRRRQWRALRRSLAFERSARTPSVAAFLEELSRQRRSPATWIGGAAAFVTVAVSVALLVPQYLQRRHMEELTGLVRSGAPGAIDEVLPQIEALPQEERAALLLEEDVRASLMEHFNARIAAATDERRQSYDYPRAAALVARLRMLFPDSQAVAQIDERLTARRNDEIKQQSDRFDELLNQGWLVEQQNPENVSRVLAIIAQIDPQHPLLKDPRLPSAYAEQAQVAIGKSELALAESLVTAGLAIASEDATLRDLADTVSRQVGERQRSERLAQLERDLPRALSDAQSLSAFESRHEDLRTYARLAPADADFVRLQARLQSLLKTQIESLIATGSYDAGQELLARYADVSEAGYVQRQRTTLDSARQQAGGTIVSTKDATVARLMTELDALLAGPAADDDDWDARITAQLARLSAYLPPRDPYLRSAHAVAAAHHIAAARELRSQSRLGAAERALGRARLHAPEHEALAQEQQLLADLRAQQDAQRRERKRSAELAALRQKLLDQATANEVDEAAASLRALRAGLAADDPFLTSQAPRALASAYLRLADGAARAGRYDVAMAQVARAVELDRDSPRAEALRKEYEQKWAAAQASAATNTASSTPATASAPGANTAQDANAGTVPKATPQATPSRSSPAPAQPTPSQPTDVQVASASSAGQSPGRAQAPTARSSACTLALAGYGTRSRGVCFDTFEGGRGPELVVVPAAAAASSAFAIGRYEVSVAEFNAYCKQSGQCEPSSAQADLPVTSIPLSLAQRYAEWLSSASGAVYRLPTDAEWVYAANANGASSERDFNCVVEIGGQKIRGFGLASVRSGRPNGWGLYNPVGNAQEWVRTTDGWSVRGGAYSDPISTCSTQLQRASGGAAETATGFRLVREMR